MAKKQTRSLPKEATPGTTSSAAKSKKGKSSAADSSNFGKGAKSQESKDTKPVNPIARPSSGKTPISLLHEHAQRSKWERVEYEMKKVKSGMVATAVLVWIDPKTKEKIQVKATHDLSGKETPIEARYDAATVALHKVCFNKSLHMVLPREYKDIWAQLESQRKDLLKQNSYKHDRLYSNDPFKVVIEDRKAKLVKEKEDLVKRSNESKSKKGPVILTSVSKASSSPPFLDTRKHHRIDSSSSDMKKQTSNKVHNVKFPTKVWESATIFKFSIKERELIQQCIKSHVCWKRSTTRDLNSSQENLLLSLGFRKSHVDEALKYQDPLSFLLFNVPDDDLPPYFADPSIKDTVTVADKNEILLRRVMEMGVSRSEAIVSLNETQADLKKAIINITCKYSNYNNDQNLHGVEVEAESQEIWQEEIETLKSIYEHGQITKLNESTVSVKLNDILKLTIYKAPFYPHQLSGLVITTIDDKLKLPNYVKLKLITKACQYITENCLGDSYIFSLVDWLQQYSAGIIEDPGPLSEEICGLDEDMDDIELQEGAGPKGRKFLRSNPDVDYIKAEYQRRKASSELQKMHQVRAGLPAWSEKENLLNVINNNKISLITGETGSGKSTQLVQFILDDFYAKGNFKTQILCTQPRRISAIGLAERVAEERVTKCGEEVGYIIRGANKSNRNTRIKFMTTGILVKFLQSGDGFLNDTVLVLDEVHERSMETDLIIIMIKKLLAKYKNMKIVMMSATVDTTIFKSYFKGLDTAHIKGRTFPIEEYYLDDILKKTDFQININDEWISPKSDSQFYQSGRINNDLISALVRKVDEDLVESSNEGSILIFLPGVAEINSCIKTLQQDFKKPCVIFPLHSALAPQDQHRVFATYKGKRKIIVSTNIAETSITINDCVVTIDSGRVKSITYNAIDNTTRLAEAFESKAESKQRKGRAGRVSNGISYKLFSRETYEKMMDNPIPEMKRINLDSLYLVVKSMGIKDVLGFLNSGMDPPPTESLLKSEEILRCSGLVDEFDDLTELGKFVSLLPIIDPKHGKLLIYSIIFGCADFGILISSILGVGSPFIHTQENRDKIKAILSNNKELGDLFATVLIVQKFFSITSSTEKRKFMNDNFLSFNKINEIKSSKSQYLSILKDIGFLPLDYRECDASMNRNEKNFNVIKSIITGAFYPQVARVQLPDPKFYSTSAGSVQADHDAKLIKYWIRNEEYISQLHQNNKAEVTVDKLPATRAFVHPSSVLFDTSNKEVDQSQLKALQNTENEREDGLIDFEILQQRKIDLTPQVRKAKNKVIAQPFVVYNASSLTSKLFLRDLTPTSTLSVLLFGGPFNYDLSSVATGKPSPGVVLDSWLPVKTWSKNAVLVKELRTLLDAAIKAKLESPSYLKSRKNTKACDDVLVLIDQLLATEMI